MKRLSTTLALLLTVALSGAVLAEEGDEPRPGPPEGRPGRGPEFRQRMLERFDADGDGRLSDDERAEAREEMHRRRGERGPRDEGGLLPERGPRRDFDRPLRSEEGSADRGPRDKKGRRGKAKGRDGRRHGPPDPDKVFDKFDANGDGQLSRAEFHELAEMMKRHRGGPDGPRMGKGRGDRRPGPPPEGRRGRRPGPPEGDSDRPRRRRPPREDRDDTSFDEGPALDDSV